MYSGSRRLTDALVQCWHTSLQIIKCENLYLRHTPAPLLYWAGYGHHWRRCHDLLWDQPPRPGLHATAGRKQPDCSFPFPGRRRWLGKLVVPVVIPDVAAAVPATTTTRILAPAAATAVSADASRLCEPATAKAFSATATRIHELSIETAVSTAT